MIMARRSGHAKKIDTVHWAGIFDSFAGLSAGSTGILMSAGPHLPEEVVPLPRDLRE